MNFKKERTKDYYLGDTHVENIFINEYMADAPGNHVKVYIFAIMYADLRMIMTNADIAKHLGMDEEDVLKAWTYWEKMGAVRKHYADPSDTLRYEVEFLNLKSMIYGNGKGKKKPAETGKSLPNLLKDEDLQSVYREVESLAGRTLSGEELQEILKWTTDWAAAPEVIIFAYRYSIKQRKQSAVKYVGKIVKEWTDKGFTTASAVSKHLEDMDERFFLYKRVLKALGMTRNATEEERRIIDSWFDEMNFDLEKVLEACGKTSGISNPNINYVNSVLKAWHNGDKKPGSGGNGSGKKSQISEVFRYYEKLREREEREAEERRREVYKNVPKIREIDEEIRRKSMEISRMILSTAPNTEDVVARAKKEIELLQSEKAFLLTENNYKIDYMDIIYACAICKDTGTQDNGEQCVCFSRRLAETQKTD